MPDLLKTLLDLIERFPALAWRSGISCAVLGAAVYGAIWIGFIRPEAFGGYAADAASIAIAVGLGCFAIGAVFTTGSMVSRVFRWAKVSSELPESLSSFRTYVSSRRPHS